MEFNIVFSSWHKNVFFDHFQTIIVLITTAPYTVMDDELLGVIFALNGKETSLEALGDATSDVSHGKLLIDHLGMIKLKTKEPRRLQTQLGFNLLVRNGKERHYEDGVLLDNGGAWVRVIPDFHSCRHGMKKYTPAPAGRSWRASSGSLRQCQIRGRRRVKGF